jgi:hypothetical protein
VQPAYRKAWPEDGRSTTKSSSENVCGQAACRTRVGVQWAADHRPFQSATVFGPDPRNLQSTRLRICTPTLTCWFAAESCPSGGRNGGTTEPPETFVPGGSGAKVRSRGPGFFQP